MAFNINEIRAQLSGGGARPNLFSVQLLNPINASGDLKLQFMAKATALPESTLGSIEVGYYGRKIKLAGDRTFPEWEVTVINDEDFLIRNALENWSNAINRHQQNITDVNSPSEYKSQAEVLHYGKNGTILRKYQFNGIFPTNIASIPLDWDTTDTIEEFSVTFQYDWWNVSGGITGNAGGQ